ncbi:MAG: nuclear transport factor 2 family protein [Rhodoglobus sp.]
MNQVDAAIAAELRLLDSTVRADASAVESLLAPDFTEIGKSGRVWSRDAAIRALLDDTSGPTEAVGIVGRVVADRLVLVSYTTGSSDAVVRRTTLWRNMPSGWQAVFHQATAIAAI